MDKSVLARFFHIYICRHVKNFFVCLHVNNKRKGLHMIYTVHVDGNAQRNFSDMQNAIKYATGMVYASPRTLIEIRDALDDGITAQWCYGFRAAAIWASERG